MGREAPLRVFLSHTSELREHPRERSYVAAAESSVMRAGHAISNMAYFTARDAEPADYCLAEIQRADVFVGIIGMRYGATVRGRPEVSYTELEFEAATAAGIPRLILLVRDDAVELPSVEQVADHAIRQQAFRRRLQDAGVTVAWVASPAETKLSLFQALVDLRDSPTHKITGLVQHRAALPREAQIDTEASCNVPLSTFGHPNADGGFWARWLFQAACDVIGQSDAEIAAALNARRGIGKTSADMIWAFRGGEDPPFSLGIAALMAADANIAPLIESLTSGRNRGKLEDVNRRHFLGAMAGFVGLTGARQPDPEPWERLAHVLQHPKRIDDATVHQLERMTVTLEQLEATVSPGALLGPVRGHFEALVELVRGVPVSDMQRRVVALASETAGIAGWLLWDLGDTGGAKEYTRAGLQAAFEAGDAALGAYLVGAASVVENRREHPGGRIDQLLAKPFGFSRDRATPATRAYLAMLEAKARARTLDEVDCLRAIDEADKAIDAAGSLAEIRPRVPFYDRVRLAGEQGLCLSRLGKSEEARRVLEDALSSLSASQQKTRPGLMTALAATHVADGNVEEACVIGSAAWEMAVRMGVEPNRQDVIELREQLNPWKNASSVKQLDEQLKASA
jgi:hypothetical protein